MKTTKIVIEIHNCIKCPFISIITKSNEWNHVSTWTCGKNNTLIEDNIEWYEENKIKVPEWCPIKIN